MHWPTKEEFRKNVMQELKRRKIKKQRRRNSDFADYKLKRIQKYKYN